MKSMFKFRAIPSLAVILVGSMDWLTSVVGISCFGAVESNPLMAGMAGASLALFTVIKLLATMSIGLLFYQGERMLLETKYKSNRHFQFTRILLRAAWTAATGFLLYAVINNLIVVAQSI